MGFDNLVIAEITEDTVENFTTGPVQILAPAGEIKKSTETSSAVKHYDNQPYINITSEGADSVEFITPVLPLDIEALIFGKEQDATTKILMDSGMPAVKYFAVGYRLLKTDGTYRYVWRNKGSFSKGDEEAKSKDDSTDTNNQTLTYTGIATVHKFTKTNKPSKAMVADSFDDIIDYDKWFEDVVTPDNISTLAAA